MTAPPAVLNPRGGLILYGSSPGERAWGRVYEIAEVFGGIALGERQVTKMAENKAAVVEKVIGDTMYIIENTVSDDARETAYERIRRLILHDTEIYQKKAS